MAKTEVINFRATKETFEQFNLLKNATRLDKETLLRELMFLASEKLIEKYDNGRVKNGKYSNS